ncbi:ABC transporter permease [Microbacterium sp. STN6]|uniref:ABC transporter permease n=1 Tax=Microbacterium sp. STN6 TaxID=2995588 RepID=UPI002260BAB3|nr:ABC transporter permease [Microbacterium sp. STN6]MCX7522484.1 ABC transporter permease [Microbacterium sp. STN6]
MTTTTVSLDEPASETRPPIEERPASRRRLNGVLPSLSPKLVVGLALAALIVLWAIVGPFLVGDPNAISTNMFAFPNGQHWLGTTQTGQDVWTQLAYGTRGSLIIGFAVGIMATVLSAIFGVLGAYIGGAIDEGFSLFTNVFLVIPGLPLVIVIGNYVPESQRGLFLIAVVLAITSWAGSARVLRAVTLSVRNRDYVSASRVSGEKTWRILVVEILPNLIPVMASQFVFAVIFAILGEAGLSFLGLGASGTFTLGTILFHAYNDLALTQGAWWWFVPPGLVIALFGCALSLINFAIDEIINPKLRDQTRSARKRWNLTRDQLKAIEQEDVR